MTTSSNPQNQDSDDLVRLIRDAGDWVIPSEQLRTTTLQQARDYQSDKRWERNAFQLGWGILVAACLLLPVADRLDSWMSETRIPNSKEVEAAALKLSQERHQDLGTSTSEVYMRIREEQAELFRTSRDKESN
jgi:hypothetical protein